MLALAVLVVVLAGRNLLQVPPVGLDMQHRPVAAHLAQHLHPLQNHMPDPRSDASSDLQLKALEHYLGQEINFPVLHAESRHRFLESIDHGQAEDSQAAVLPWCLSPYSVIICLCRSRDMKATFRAWYRITFFCVGASQCFCELVG